MWLQKEIQLKARARGFHLITDEILGQIPELRQIAIGMMHVFIKHTSASLTINENADPTVRKDFESYFNVAVPENEPYYRHLDEGSDAESQQAIVITNDGKITASTAPTITTQYVPRPDGEFGTGILFIKTKNSEVSNTVAYYHHDHLGTPVQATDRSGIIVWSAQYNAFGNVSITTPMATEDKPVIESSLRFPGQIEDAETGLYYNWHRYYDPELGRYVTADPIGLGGGINFYAYVGGNPVKEIDSEGLLVPDPKCNSAQREAITGAEKEINDILDKGCSECIKGACVPCEFYEKLKNLISSTKVSCSEKNDGDCAVWLPGSEVIEIKPYGFDSTGKNGCGCLKSTIYHELFHAASLGNEDHYEIEKNVMKCFRNCARQHNPKSEMV